MKSRVLALILALVAVLLVTSATLAETPTAAPRGRTGKLAYKTKIDRALQGPELELTVNYGDDWVSGHYATGHTVWLTVTESDGSTAKALAEVTTAPMPSWGGESGFQTQEGDWSPAQPDIAVGDWVYGSTDDDSSTSARVGAITADLDVDTDVVSGTITAPWFSGTLDGLCTIWEESGPEVAFTTGTGGSYSCDLGGEGWDLKPGDDVAVQYQEPDGDWVLNHFHVPAPHLGVEKSADGDPCDGGNFVFEITYWNSGDGAAESVVLTDTLEGMSYLADTSSFSPVTGTTPGGDEYVVWDLGTVPPQEPIQFEVFVQVTAGVSETVINTADIATSNPYDEGEPSEKHSEWGHHVEENDTHLDVEKSASPESPPPGSDFTYVVEVCNDGSTGSSEIVLTDTLELTTTLEYWWADEAGWVEKSSGDDQLVIARPSLAAGECSQVTLKVHVDEGASPDDPLCNIALISADNDIEWDDNVAEYNHAVGDYPFFVPLVMRKYN
jgi:uncharacterized repeat protein (TIGR01451 family)